MDKRIESKKLGMYGGKEGGRERQEMALDEEKIERVSDEEILEVGGMGREMEGDLGQREDMEWCLEGDSLYIVESGPIT
ncbi:PEP/pyruvate-binding domain-containing protein, partial [Bacillus velezensis]|uniref:PEP/pyruvate-binding domain-containing protein n=1 Tax=Bacillus velezensis TaxID=492670 RepID=UPI0021B5D91B